LFDKPIDYGSTFYCWSYSLLHRVINEIFSLNLSLTCVYNNLVKLGFKLATPKKIFGKASQEKIDEYRQKYNELISKFNPNTDVLFHFDECCVDLDPKRYSKVLTLKGLNPIVVSKSKYGRINISGFVSPITHEIDMLRIPYGNSKTFILHLSLLQEKYHDKENIYIITDNAKWHKSKETNDWLSLNRKIKILFLPPYCPNMNIVERFWWYLKTFVIRNEVFDSHYCCLERVFKFFKELSFDIKQIAELCCI